MAECPDDSVERAWISRHSQKQEVCMALDHIDGEQFYRKYLLKVFFPSTVFIILFLKFKNF